MTVFILFIDMFLASRRGAGIAENVTPPNKMTLFIVSIDVFSGPRRGPGCVGNVTPPKQNDSFHSFY